MPKRWKIGLDVGGTFTDVIAVDPGDGTVKMAKVLSQSKDPVSGLEAACGALGIDPSDVADLMLGTTLATNAIVQGRLAPIALAMTRGFVDTLDIGRQNRRELYRLDAPPKLPPLVPRERRLEVAERLDAAGNVVAALDDAEIRRLVEQIEAMGVEAVAISLLHSYANGSHETRLAERLKDSVRFVAQSHELSPEPREYERTNSTALNAALMPLVTRYLERLESWAGDATGLHLFHSAGGMAAADTVRAQPLALALSGPAAGVAAAAKVAAELQLSAVIAFDMGGTTTDVSIVVDGNAQVGSNHRLAGYPIRQVMVAVESIGAGGGSIARLDGTAIRVGPDSAGADPGPACYGLGGTEPTVTDANILLGYLDPDQLGRDGPSRRAEGGDGPGADSQGGQHVPRAAPGDRGTWSRCQVLRLAGVRRRGPDACGGAGPRVRHQAGHSPQAFQCVLGARLPDGGTRLRRAAGSPPAQHRLGRRATRQRRAGDDGAALGPTDASRPCTGRARCPDHRADPILRAERYRRDSHGRAIRHRGSCRPFHGGTSAPVRILHG